MRDITWNEAVEMCHKLSRAIKDSGYRPGVLIGVARGGLVPLGILSYDLDTRSIHTIALKFYGEDKTTGARVEQITPFHAEDLEKYRRVLLIDDVADTGKTLEYVMSKLRGKEVKVATLLYKPEKSKIKPDYYIEETDEWVNFPWSV